MKIVKWKFGTEVKDMKNDNREMIVMFGCTRPESTEEKGKRPCDVRIKGVCNNSTSCTDDGDGFTRYLVA